MKNTEPWYGAKCVFLHHDLTKRNGRPCYEERITLVKAGSFAAAIAKAEKGARSYAASLGSTEYLGFVDVFHVFESKITEGVEVYSIMRSKRLSKKAFIDRYYDDGSFHSRRSSYGARPKTPRRGGR